ncbi:Spy/CpxP family protein refolding chaperone [Methylococcus sp. EFPC2]|uniref:Spy/CpxP family protein refolding chaperone n=1 Tax=Methylococcus sp. EFPC2 TaxID=2812648 RepID=UPI00196835B2|nr:Spy/CpxP family protein refolding chaperone [Methylococcus sp. EFPC2]QSA96103.1 Spy/CpxP family protein refolding chaperone [Methylococcus sp. EFPC2]
MNRNTYKAYLLAAGIVLALPFSLNAEPHHPPVGHGAGHWIEGPTAFGRHFLKDLNLTDEQRARIGEIRKAQKEAVRAKFDAVRKRQEDLRNLALSADYTEEKAQALGNEHAKAVADLALERARVEHEIYQLLLPEQQEKLKEKIEKFRAHHGKRFFEGAPSKAE